MGDTIFKLVQYVLQVGIGMPIAYCIRLIAARERFLALEG
jgi:hypothetical protein